MMSEDQILAGYQEAWQSAAYFQFPGAGSLSIAGKDREAFIQRQTTNDIRVLQQDRALLTVLTSPTARILDVLYLVVDQDQIRALTLASTGEATARYLKSRIFFMDQVTVQDTSTGWARIQLVGPVAAQIVEKAFGISLPEVDRIVSLAVGHDPVWCTVTQPSILPGCMLVVPAIGVKELIDRLDAAGARRLSPEAWEIVRVEWGLPGPQTELNEEYTPLEVGLAVAISDSKGCYTGQEIIARQITYDKITQQLCIISMDRFVQPGVQIRAEGKKAGVLTSIVDSPHFGPLGLAVIKRPYHSPGTSVELEVEEGGRVEARIVQKPMQEMP